MDTISSTNSAADLRSVSHRLAKTRSREVTTKGAHDRVLFDGAAPPAVNRARRGSLHEALEGSDDDFSTREKLAQRVAMASASLGALTPRRSLGVVGRTGQRLWMPILMLVLGTAMLLVPLHSALLEHSTNAWGGDDDDPAEAAELIQRFDVNEPVGAFLGVTALVYALIFAAAYSEAHSRLDEIRSSLTTEANGVHTAMLLVRTLDAGNDSHQTRALLLFASYIEQLSDEISSGGIADVEEHSSIETLYAAVPFLSKICNDGANDEMDRVLVQRTIDMINHVSQARSVRETATHNGLSWITLLFLLEMGIITFFGVLMLQTGTAALNITLPVLTLVALVSSVLFLADLALPFAGIVQVDVSIFDRIRQSISAVLASVNQDQCTTLWVGRVPRSMIDCEISLAADRMRGLFTRFGKVRSVTLRKKTTEFGSWALVTFESEQAAERALEGEVCWKSTEVFQCRKANLEAAGAGVAKKIIEQHNAVDATSPRLNGGLRVSSKDLLGEGEGDNVAASKHFDSNQASYASAGLPGTVSPLVSSDGSGGERRTSTTGVTIDADKHVEVAQRLARRRTRRASIV